MAEAGAYALGTWQCEHTAMLSAFCPTPDRFVANDAPRAAGAALGLLASALIRVQRADPSPLLSAAAIIPLAWVLMQVATAPFTPVGPDTAVRIALVTQAGHLLMWIGAGVIAGRLHGGLLAVVVLVLTIALPATFGIKQALVLPGSGEMRLWQAEDIAADVAFIAVLVIAWSRARRRADTTWEAVSSVPTDGT